MSVFINMKYLVGIDEVGRGPIAGPVAVGAFVIFDNKIKRKFRGIKESKQLSSPQREKWYEIIKKERVNGTLDFVVSFSSNEIIDKKGLSWAIKSCLKNSLKELKKVKENNSKILLDGGLKAPIQYKDQKTIIKGDEKFVIIALASIVAKVERDRKMVKLSKKYPQYGFEKHMGYGTKFHLVKIKELGITKYHRKSFIHE
jgi:ribonuclease HII